jgi:hypothetical protein
MKNFELLAVMGKNSPLVLFLAKNGRYFKRQNGGLSKPP